MNVRIIAATHRDLRREVEARRFREDLLYRLRVFPIDIPPLRQRLEDVAPLARRQLAGSAAHTGREVRLSPEALQMLEAYRWPGNVRELENALEYAATVAMGRTIQPENLPPEILAPEEDPALATRRPDRRARQVRRGGGIRRSATCCSPPFTTTGGTSVRPRGRSRSLAQRSGDGCASSASRARPERYRVATRCRDMHRLTASAIRETIGTTALDEWHVPCSCDMQGDATAMRHGSELGAQ